MKMATSCIVKFAPRLITRFKINTSSLRLFSYEITPHSDVPQSPAFGKKPEDAVTKAFHSVHTRTQLLETYMAHVTRMDVPHVCVALSTLFQVQKSANFTSSSNAELVNDTRFISLCGLVQRKAKHFDMSELINALKVFTAVGIDAQSQVIQTVLQLLRHQISHLELDQIIFLEFLLKRTKDGGKLRDGILIALPAVFQAKMSVGLEVYDPKKLVVCLQYATEHSLPVDSIVTALHDHMENLEPQLAASVLISNLRSSKITEYSLDLISKCFRILKTDLSKVSPDQLLAIATSFTKLKALQRSVNISSFLDSVSDLAVARNWNYLLSSKLIRQLAKIGHFHRGLADYVCCHYIANSSSTVGQFPVVNALATFGYKPLNWTELKDKILKQKEWMRLDAPVPHLRVALDMAVLDLCPPDLIHHVFTEEFSQANKKTNISYVNFLDQLQLVTLHSAVTCLHKHIEVPPLPRCTSEVLSGRLRQSTFPLRGALEVGVGGKEYVATGVYTRYGLFVDHALMVRKGCYPIAFETDAASWFLEDLVPPQDGHIVVVMLFRPSMCLSNVHIPKGVFDLERRCLEAQGYVVVPIIESSWQALADGEKIVYLMQKIKEKCEIVESDRIKKEDVEQ